MPRSIVRNGLKLLLISIVFRIISYIFFSFSWQWSSVFIRAIEIGIGVLFLGIWLIYGLKKRAGFKNGLTIGLIGAGDAILLTLLSFILFVNRDSYYFGPIEMMLWDIPLLGVFNQLSFQSNVLTYTAPFIAILLTAAGSFLSKHKQTKII